MYMNNIKLFAKNEKEQETLIHTVRIYSQDIGMELGIDKCTMLVMKSGKRHLTDGMELPNQNKNWTLGEKETNKYLGILEADAVKQVRMKDKIKKEYLRSTRKLLETKLCGRSFIKEVNTWALHLVRYSGTLSQIDQRRTNGPKTRKLMTMHKALHPRHGVDNLYMYQERQEEEDLSALKTALTHRHNDSRDYIEKHGEGTDYSHQKTILTTQRPTGRQYLENKNENKKQFYGRF